MMNYSITTSASLYEKAEALDLLVLTAPTPGHARIFRRVAHASRIAAALARIAETAETAD